MNNYTPEQHFAEILKYIGEDPNREGLIDTPVRYVKMLRQLCDKPQFNLTVFDSEGMDQMIVVTGIPFFSLCEHHIAPFFGTGAIGYIPSGKIVGLSKLPRTLDYFAAGLQNQERITQAVADFLFEQLNPQGVAVSLCARHLCMEMRGVKKHDTHTTTTAFKGLFETSGTAKAEFLDWVKAKPGQ